MSRSFKKILSFVAFLALSISIPFIAHAFLAEGIAFVLLGVIIALLLGVSNIVLMVAIWIMQWVLSENFIDWGYTHNPVVDMGWGLTRDLGNMFFVIYLAFVGLATALRIEKYKTQKILPTLVLVALLVNFSPVICGVIVDASNILMSFFLSESGGGGWQAFATQVTNLKSGILGGGLGQALDPVKIIGVYGQAIILVVFNVIAAALYFLFAFIFAARYLAIWLLVILSPLAFFSLAVPDLKSFWTQWWNMFIQWCFVGVTAGFFLYLGHHMMVEADSMMGTVSPGEGVIGILTGPIIQLLHFIIPYGIALGFLGMGFFAALGSSAKGANIAIKGAKLAGSKAGGFAETQWDRLRTSKQGEEIAKGLAEAPHRLKRLTPNVGTEEYRKYRETWGEASTGKKLGMVIRTVAPFSGYAARPALEAVAQGRQEIAEKRKKYEKQFKENPQLLEEFIKTLPQPGSVTAKLGLHWQDRIATTLAAGDAGGPQSLDKIEEAKPGHLQDILRMTETYGQRKMMKDLVTLIPGQVIKTEKDENIEDKLKDNLGGIKMENYTGGRSFESMPPKEQEQVSKQIMGDVDAKLSEMGDEAARIAVRGIIFRGVKDENVRALMEAGRSVGHAVVEAVFVTVAEGFKKAEDIEKAKDVTLKNPILQEAFIRHGNIPVLRAMFQRGGDISEQTRDKWNELGAEEIKKTNNPALRWGVFSLEGQSLVGPTRGAETKDKYRFLDSIENMNQQELREMSQGIQEEINTMTAKIQKEISRAQGEINKTRKAMDTMSKTQKKDAELYIEKLEAQEAGLKSKQSPRHNEDIAKLEDKMDIIKRHLRPTGKPKKESKEEKEKRLRIGEKAYKERNP